MDRSSLCILRNISDTKVAFERLLDLLKETSRSRVLFIRNCRHENGKLVLVLYLFHFVDKDLNGRILESENDFCRPATSSTETKAKRPLNTWLLSCRAGSSLGVKAPNPSLRQKSRIHILAKYDFVEQDELGHDASKDENAEKGRGEMAAFDGGSFAQSTTALDAAASDARRECNAHMKRVIQNYTRICRIQSKE